MKTLVVGGGYWGQNYIRELGHKCVFVLDSDPRVCADLRQRFDVPCGTALHRSVQDTVLDSPVQCTCIEDVEYEAVIVCTPPDTHYLIAKTFLDAGKYVLVEKPMTMNVTEAEDLVYYDKCMAGLIYLFHPGVEALRRFYQRGTWSHLYSRRTNEGPARKDVSVLWDLAPHDISIFNYITGETPEVEKLESRDYAVLRLTYSSVTAVSYVSWCGGPKTRLVELVPVSGDRVIFDDMQITPEKSPLARMLEAFLSKNWDRSTALDGLNVVRALS